MRMRLVISTILAEPQWSEKPRYRSILPYGELTVLHYAVNAQMAEMEMVRQKIYTLEQNQHAIKQRYFSISQCRLFC